MVSGGCFPGITARRGVHGLDYCDLGILAGM